MPRPWSKVGMSCLMALAAVMAWAPGLCTCSADVRLPKVLASHMVLQQQAQVTIWGTAEPEEAVSVGGDWLDALQRTSADAHGRWRVTLPTGKAGGPHTITVTGKNSISLTDILFGEVWLASGQSNMEMPLIPVSGAYTGIRDYESEVQAADHPDLRLFQVGNFSAKEPRDDVESGIEMYGIPAAKCRWQSCTPETVRTFSSTAYFFARELHQRLGVPVGIIDASWGGTAAEAWTPEPGLRKLGYDADLKLAAELAQQPDRKVPTRLYNGMIHPLRQSAIQGVVWYQGEGNVVRAERYRSLFAMMIEQWRGAFERDLDFYYVQIAPFNYRGRNAAFLREAQLRSLAIPDTGMVVTMDIGDLTDIHPKNKQDVGRRLALCALAGTYGKELVHSGPIFKECQFDGHSARITFDHTADGLSTSDGKAPTHFEIAGPDKVFHPATASIEGKALVVTSDRVGKPEAVRFAFSSTATPNLMNSEGLPASPFRTDAWQSRP